jgi:membrane associated rhomboid family serine protease
VGTLRLYSDVRSPFRPATVTFIAVCVAVYAFGRLSGDTTPLPEWRALTSSRIGTGSFWLWLFPAAVSHSGLWHLVTNLTALTPISSHFERRFGALRTAGLMTASAALASTAQLLAGGRGDIGSSGVVFAFVGFLAVYPEPQSTRASRILRWVVAGLLLWFAYCFVANAVWGGTYGNASHTCGLLVGALCGAIARDHRMFEVEVHRPPPL